MRSNILSLALGLMAPALIGCGDNGTGTSPDAAKQPDGPSGPDASTFKGFDADEGGEVRVEYVRFANNNAAARVTGFAWEPTNPSYYEYLNLNGCTDMRQKDKWPMATNDVATRNYLDVGTLTIKGGPMDLVVNKNPMMANDPFARTHPADEWYFKGATNTTNDATMYLPEKTALDVVFGGSAEVPAQTFEDVIYMPTDFVLTSPVGHDMYPIPAYALTSADHTFTWTTPTDMAPNGARIDSLVAFTGSKGPVVVCIEPNDGSMTVPKAMVDIARAEYPMGATLARQTLVHQVRELKDANGPTGRRIDFIGVWCYATSFAVPPI